MSSEELQNSDIVLTAKVKDVSVLREPGEKKTTGMQKNINM